MYCTSVCVNVNVLVYSTSKGCDINLCFTPKIHDLFIDWLNFLFSVYCQDMSGPVFIQEPPNNVDFSNSTGSVIHWLVDGSIGGSIYWWMFDWFMDECLLINWLIDWLIDWLIGECLIDWLTNVWLIDWLIDCLIDWLNNLLIDW